MTLKKDLVINEVAGQTIIVDLAKDEQEDKLVSTNKTGAFLLKLLQAGTTEDEMTAALLKKYEVDEPTAMQHIQLFLNGLKELQFLEE